MHEDAPLYEAAAQEIAHGKADRGIFAKAFSDALGDESQTRALYLKYRVEQLRAQLETMRREQSEMAARESRLHSTDRKIYLAELKERFGYLCHVKIPESEIPSAVYHDALPGLGKGIHISDVSDALKMLEFRLIDAVKAGLVTGILDTAGEWWLWPKK